MVVAPTSMSALPTVFRPEVEVAGRRRRVLTEQIRALDRSRLGRRVGTLAQTELRTVDDALKLGLFQRPWVAPRPAQSGHLPELHHFAKLL
jgi:mRNA interferase MazF